MTHLHDWSIRHHVSLQALDAATLAQMQQAIAHVDGAPTIPWGATPAIQGAVAKRHRERQEAQAACARYMDWLTGVPSALNAVIAQCAA